MFRFKIKDDAPLITFGQTKRPTILSTRTVAISVDEWTKDGTKIESLLYASNNLEKASELFAAIKHRPRIRLTIRQRTRARPAAMAAIGLSQ